jgi:hypothetical protein
MRSIFTFLLLSCFCTQGFAQPNVSFSFDTGDSLYTHFFFLDTTSYHHNSWQIGKPGKTNFDSARSYANAIITDTSAPYPANDTSVFTMKFASFIPPSVSNPWSGIWQLHFFYKLDIDSGEIAKIELSTDTGQHWIVLSTDSIASPTYTSSGLLHNSQQWQQYQVNFGDFQSPNDTFLVRFTFISDSSNTGREGWMMDDFMLWYWSEGLVQTVRPADLVQVYPNPCKGELRFRDPANSEHARVAVYTPDGKQVFTATDVSARKPLSLPIADGRYILKYETNAGIQVRQIVVAR